MIGLYQDNCHRIGPAVDILYEGTAWPTASLQRTAYSSGTAYDVSGPPLGALQQLQLRRLYLKSRQKLRNSGALLLDNVGRLPFSKAAESGWPTSTVTTRTAQQPAGALNLIELVDGDRVEFYYGDSASANYNAVKAAATAAVRCRLTGSCNGRAL